MCQGLSARVSRNILRFLITLLHGILNLNIYSIFSVLLLIYQHRGLLARFGSLAFGNLIIELLQTHLRHLDTPTRLYRFLDRLNSFGKTI